MLTWLKLRPSPSGSGVAPRFTLSAWLGRGFCAVHPLVKTTCQHLARCEHQFCAVVPAATLFMHGSMVVTMADHITHFCVHHSSSPRAEATEVRLLAELDALRKEQVGGLLYLNSSAINRMLFEGCGSIGSALLTHNSPANTQPSHAWDMLVSCWETVLLPNLCQQPMLCAAYPAWMLLSVIQFRTDNINALCSTSNSLPCLAQTL
jgi:hypothetical protein